MLIHGTKGIHIKDAEQTYTASNQMVVKVDVWQYWKQKVFNAVRCPSYRALPWLKFWGRCPTSLDGTIPMTTHTQSRHPGRPCSCACEQQRILAMGPAPHAQLWSSESRQEASRVAWSGSASTMPASGLGSSREPSSTSLRGCQRRWPGAPEVRHALQRSAGWRQAMHTARWQQAGLTARPRPHLFLCACASSVS